MKPSFLKSIAIVLMLAFAPLTISNAQAAVKIGSYVGNWKPSITYAGGDLITYRNQTFLSLVKNKAKNPNANLKVWQVFGIGPIGPEGLQGPAGIGSAGKATGDMQWWNGWEWVMIPVGANNTILKNCNGIPTWVASAGSCPFIIGDPGPAGGIIFYLSDNTGLHGLEAAPVDQAQSTWGCFGAAIDGTSAAIGTGLANTNKVVARCAEANTAAKVAQAYTLNGFSDWYLPSKDELQLMRNNIGQGANAPLTNVGGFATNYWSSTEGGSYDAWAQLFGNGSQYNNGKDFADRVRAVRAF